jgi:hypothetical protein
VKKIEGAIKNEQSKNIGNNGYTTHNKDIGNNGHTTHNEDKGNKTLNTEK